MNREFETILLKILTSLIVGMIIGAEREFRHKAAGLRTITMICLGATMFTILSERMGAPEETTRIASNIVTGIGFLGAGAILREGFTVIGLTTASTIWVAASLGVAVGAGYFRLAIFTSFVVLFVLTLFGGLQRVIDSIFKRLEIRIVFDLAYSGIEKQVEETMRSLKLKFDRTKEFRRNKQRIFFYTVWGREANVSRLIAYLSKAENIRDFEYL